MVQGGTPTPTVSSYEISNATLNLQSYLLSDVVLRTLNEMSASSGLELVHQTVYAAVGQRNSSLLTSEIGKSASRCIKALYHEKQVSSSALTQDPFASPTWSSTYYVQELQWYKHTRIRNTPHTRIHVCFLGDSEVYFFQTQVFEEMAPDRARRNCTHSRYRLLGK